MGEVDRFLASIDEEPTRYELLLLYVDSEGQVLSAQHASSTHGLMSVGVKKISEVLGQGWKPAGVSIGPGATVMQFEREG